ncbi:AbiV family abortive infection protein [uncultured Christiangramia sp.]|uniref:AbiV family abortive infection protein n=1 Tax=uncultured Christiangramia sp. TaxID=503836 RepID=UPI002616EF0B|nr:AbiV family abortive infection protein [uncultured Christiangramia sp.]
MEEKIISALYYTFENIKGLNEEAHILKKHSKFGRTYTLFHLCFEECGRFHLLHDYLMDFFNYKIEARDFTYGHLKKLGYENHRLKLIQSIEGMRRTATLFLMLSRSQNNLENDGEEFDRELEEINNKLDEITLTEKELDKLKNVGLYVTYSDNEFHLPDKSITAKQFIDIQKLANLGLEQIQTMMEFYESKGGFLAFKNEMRKILDSQQE